MKISPLEVFIFFAGVLVTVFTNIENGIYTTIAVSVAMLLFRVAKAKGRFLGKVKVHSVIGDHLLEGEDDSNGDREGKPPAMVNRLNPGNPEESARNVFLPLDHDDGSNPQIEIDKPYPGIFIYRFSEGYNYPNANHYLDNMVATIFKETRRTNSSTYGKLGDRPWNDPGPRRGKKLEVDEDLPTLKAIILDFSSVNNVDVTSIQHIIDVRNQLDRYASPDTVEWHIACINNRWTKRALAAAGFGYPTPESEAGSFHRWKPIFSVAELGGVDSAAEAAEWRENERALKRARTEDIEEAQRSQKIAAKDFVDSEDSSAEALDLHQHLSNARPYNKPISKIVVVHGVNRPFFHVDLTSALQSAIASIERKERAEQQRTDPSLE